MLFWKCSEQREKPFGACNYCEKTCHWTNKCYKRLKDNKSKKSREISSNEEENIAKTKDYLFVVENKNNNLNENYDELWYIDSGATQHMTSPKKFFKSYRNIDTVDIFPANSYTVRAIGKGDIEVKSPVVTKRLCTESSKMCFTYQI